MLRAAVLVLLGGCDYLFQIDQVDEIDAALVAIESDAAAVVPCANPYRDERFDDEGTPCAPWGMFEQSGNCTAQETAEGLVFQPAAQLESRCKCNASLAVPFTDTGIMVEVARVLAGTDDDFTLLSFYDLNLSLGVSSGVLRFQNQTGTTDHGSIAYDRATMKWWRVRRAVTSAIAEYSRDGGVWTQVGTAVPTTAATAQMYLFAGLADSTGDGYAAFRRLIVCM